MRHEVIAGPARVLFEVIFGIMHLIFNRINKRRVFRAINSGAVIGLISLLPGFLEAQPIMSVIVIGAIMVHDIQGLCCQNAAYNHNIDQPSY